MINDTIAAISTPRGRGGIAVIRISGGEAITAANKVFRPKNGKGLEEAGQSKVVYGDIYADGRKIDDGLAIVFFAPHSFTGENTVEISCHGGNMLASMILKACFDAGCRQAGPGEFTRRAFVNGKIALTQAEAVIDLIDAESEEKIRLASKQTDGVLSRKISQTESELTDLLSEAYVTSDYPDEDLSELTENALSEGIDRALNELKKTASTYRYGSAVCEGVRTVIAGKPNTGKSSLLNALLGRERAIVTSVPGTTRDTIEENVNISGVTLRLCDTAGIRISDDEVEKIGIERSKEAVENAANGLVLAVFDGSEDFDGDDLSFIDFLKKQSGTVIPVINKNDKGVKADIDLLSGIGKPVYISVADGTGIEELKKAVAALYDVGKIDVENDAVVTNARQMSSIGAAIECLENASRGLAGGNTADMVCLDLEQACVNLAEMDGRGVAEEITDKIFHRFCVGK